MIVSPEFLTVEDVEQLYDAMIGISARTCSKAQFAALLEQLAKPFVDD